MKCPPPYHAKDLPLKKADPPSFSEEFERLQQDEQYKDLRSVAFELHEPIRLFHKPVESDLKENLDGFGGLPGEVPLNGPQSYSNTPQTATHPKNSALRYHGYAAYKLFFPRNFSILRTQKACGGRIGLRSSLFYFGRLHFYFTSSNFPKR